MTLTFIEPITPIVALSAVDEAQQLVRDARREQMHLMALDAVKRGLTLEPDITFGAFVVRDPAQLHVCQITSPFSCTCLRYEVWRRCEHVALVRERLGLNR